MTERKKILLEKDNQILDDILKSLTQPSQEIPTEETIQKALTRALSSLRAGKVSPTAIQIITEVLRLSAPRNVLGPVDIGLYFESILAILPHQHLDLSHLIRYRIAALLKDSVIIAAYFDAYSKVALNREHFEAVLSIFVEENESCRQLIPRLLDCNPVPKSLLSKVIRFINISALSDDQYIKLFTACASCMVVSDLRIVTSRNRIHFVRVAINFFKDEISRAYVNDRDARIRSIIAASNPGQEVFSRLLHDPAEEVRVSLLEPLSWERACILDIADRVVDKSFKVREIMFRIYREGVFRLPCPSIFDPRICKLAGQSNITAFDGKIILPAPSSKTTDSESKAKEVEVLKSFVYKLFEGCLTCYQNEFVKVLQSSGLTLDFLYESRDKPGVVEYLRTVGPNVYTNIPDKYLGFYLEHIFKGELTDAEVRDYLNNNIFEVLKHVKVPERHYELLLQKATTCSSLNSIEDIVQKIKHILSTRDFIGDAGNQEVLPNVLFINAHTACSSEFIERQLLEEVSFPRLYFLVHQVKSNELVRKALHNTNLTEEQRISLLIYLNDPLLLCEHANFLLERPLTPRAHTKILSAKTVTASILYFLATGKVSIKNPLFFLLCVRVASHCRVVDAVKRVFIRYVSSVEQAVFDMFYSICWELKSYVIGDVDGKHREIEGTGLHKSISLENKENNALPGHSNKLELKTENKMLYFICDLVIGQRNATLCEVTVDLTKHGFVKLSDASIEMIRHGQVIYE